VSELPCSELGQLEFKQTEADNACSGRPRWIGRRAQWSGDDTDMHFVPAWRDNHDRFAVEFVVLK
jgi:hypothetical protein